MPISSHLRRLIVPVVLLLGGHLRNAAQAPSPNTLPKPVVVHFDSFLGRGLSVKASFNGVEGTFLFDTGGGLTNVSTAFAARIGCKPWGQISGFTMEAHRIDMQHCDDKAVTLAGVTLPVPVLGVVDLTGMMPPDAPHLDGTIGLDALAGRAFTFSYATRTLTFESASSFPKRIAALQPVPMRIVRDGEGAALSVDLGIPTPSGMAFMVLDSGNVSPLGLLGKHLALLYKADPAKRDPQPLDLQLVGGKSFHGDFVVRDLIMDGNLGTNFLSQWDITVDLGAGKAWMAPASA